MIELLFILVFWCILQDKNKNDRFLLNRQVGSSMDSDQASTSDENAKNGNIANTMKTI